MLIRLGCRPTCPRSAVKAEIKSFEWGEYRKRVQAGEHQMAMFGWTGDNGDPDNFLHTLLGCAAAQPGGGNIAKFCYQPYEDLVLKAKTVTSQAERTKLYQQAQVVFMNRRPGSRLPTRCSSSRCARM